MPVLPEVGSRIVWPGRDRALLLGVLDQRARDAVLDRAGRVVGLELGPDAHARLGRQPLELDERRVADRLDDVAVAAAAGAVPQLLRPYFRKCSHQTRYRMHGPGTPRPEEAGPLSYSRRDVLRMAGAGGAALWLGGCGGSSNTAKPVAGDEWKQFGGTTLNFISENTAPTSAIAANLKPFTDLTGIEIKIAQLELAALVQKVALDFASGVGSYQIVYADPYQILAPYHEALVDLNTMMNDPDLPKLDDVGDFIPTQLDAAGKLRRQGQALRAALRRADDDLAVPQGPVREVRRPHEAGPRLRPDALGRLDLGGVLQDLQVVQGERPGRRPLRPRPPGQAARLADERLLERAVGLRRRLLQGRRQRRPARLLRPRRPGARLRRGDRGGRLLPPARLDRPSRQPRLGLGRARRRVRAPARWRWPSTGTSSPPATRPASSRARSATRASPAAPSAARACTAARASGSTPRPEREQKAAWLFVNWATSRRPSSPTSRARSAAARRRATRSTSCPRSRRPEAAVEDAQHPHRRRGLRGVEAGEHRPAPEDRRLERVRHGDLHRSSRRCSPASRARRSAWPTRRTASKAIDNADSLRNA